jgi:type IV pilus assembly protein PilA
MINMRRTGKNDGFTLAELLVVVAIIAVLVAVSIPIFSSQATKAKAATDMANVRAAKAAAVADYLSSGSSEQTTYYYDASKGTVTTKEEDAKTITGYGKSTSPVSNATGTPYDNGTAHIVSITIAEDGTQTASWVLGTGTGSSSGSTSGSTSSSPLSSITGSRTWSSIQGDVNKYGTTLLPGTLVTDNGKQYLVYGNTNWYQNSSAQSMADLVASNSTNMEEVTKSTPLITVTTDMANLNIAAGTIALYNGKYYCAKQDITYNQWEHKTPESESRFALITDQ